ncbi:protein kinase [Clostridium sp. SM-530-WT-3G]|uniref:protein kinase n=1 Tax=Clostridium sp. SM-530-WT-3G TaxID=2725303 RepID=UPI00145D6848|nr:protein kinase [Clostridium sp. SM-530-WT-3G]NME82217.1 protein kinase [Clostridium sp. SM-530-WT-3G]
MKKNFAYSADFDEDTEILFREATYLGQGNNGIVYKLPGNKVIKLFLSPKVCNDEGSILVKTKESKYFPKIYKKGRLYIVREMVQGEQLDKYIKKNGLSDKLIENIYNLLKEFRRLKFKKIDTRCKDILVSEDESLMIIDPKKAYVRKMDYPRHLMKGLYKLGTLDRFFTGLNEIDKKASREWKEKFYKYCDSEEI